MRWMTVLKAKSTRGFTLIEIIISIAILGIIVVALLPVFTAGFKGIASAGNKSKTSYQSQDLTEVKIAEGAASSSTSLTIVFPGVASVTMDGEKVVNGSIVLFMPK